MRNSIKITTRAIVELVEETCGYDFSACDDEFDVFEHRVHEILEENFPAHQTTIDFTPAFNVSMNSTSSTSTNSVPKEIEVDQRKEETRYNSRNPKGRSVYTPRRDSNIRDKK